MTSKELTDRLGWSFDLPHLAEALTHPSYANEQRKGRRTSSALPPDNQRLEFLGDAVLGFCVSEALMDLLPGANEGELTLVRASLVNAEALATWARSVDLGAALRLGRGADATGERARTNVLADAVEALVAAVYLDRGLEAAQALTRVIVGEPLDRLAQGGAFGRDPKTELQEQVQAAGLPSPRYHVVTTEGPTNRREFVVEVEVDGAIVGVGRGRSKKLAERAAAHAAIEARAAPPSASSEPPSPSPG